MVLAAHQDLLKEFFENFGGAEPGYAGCGGDGDTVPQLISHKNQHFAQGLSGLHRGLDIFTQIQPGGYLAPGLFFHQQTAGAAEQGLNLGRFAQQDIHGGEGDIGVNIQQGIL